MDEAAVIVPDELRAWYAMQLELEGPGDVIDVDAIAAAENALLDWCRKNLPTP